MNPVASAATGAVEGRDAAASFPSWRTIGVPALAGLLYAAFWLCDWRVLVDAQAAVLAAMFDLIRSTVRVSNVDLITAHGPLRLDAECTYADLFLCSAPFVAAGKDLRGAAIGVGLLLLWVSAINLARVFLAVLAFDGGVSFTWAHDVPDFVLWYGTLVWVAAAWWRAR